MMVGNVQRGVAGNAGIAGIDVAGKTGTAETGIGNGRTFWFSGFAPADNPQIALAIAVEGDRSEGTGNAIAGPIANTIFAGVIKP
jgi:peptidoglycan glycosyltransferase